MYETDRLLVRVIDSEYSLEVAEYYERNRGFLKDWEVERKEMFYTEKFQRVQLHKDTLDTRGGKLLRLWIFKKKNKIKIESKDKLIGNIVVSKIRLGKHPSCELGYKLDLDEINKGYITEALTKVIDIIFNDYNFYKILLKIVENNKASLRVAEKLGFKRSEKPKEFIKVDGKDQEYINMVLLNPDMI